MSMTNEEMDLLAGTHAKGQAVESFTPKGDYVITFNYRGSEIGYCGTCIRVRQVRKTHAGCLKVLADWKERAKDRGLSILLEDIRIYKLSETLPSIKIGR